MNYKLRYLPLAVQDIQALSDYLATFYPSTSTTVLGELKRQLAKLVDFPELYEVYAPDPFYRRMPVCKHLVFYHINVQLQTIDVHRVLRASWNLPTYL